MFPLLFVCVCLFLLQAPVRIHALGSGDLGDSCQISFLLTQLTGMNEDLHTVRAGFWLAADCEKNNTVTSLVEFPSADDLPTLSYYEVETEDGRTKSSVFVSGKFLDFFSLKRWPMDSHDLNILIESLQDTNDARLRIDSSSSGVKPDLHLMEGWKGGEFKTEAREVALGSDLGGLLSGSEKFDSLTFSLTISREDVSAFFRAIGVPLGATLFAFVLVILSTKIVPQLAVRVSGTVAVFFSIGMSFLNLPRTSYMKTVDYVHLFAIVAVLALFELALFWTVLHDAEVAPEKFLVLFDLALVFFVVWAVGMVVIPLLEDSDEGLFVLLAFLAFSQLSYLVVFCVYSRKLWSVYVKGAETTLRPPKKEKEGGELTFHPTEDVGGPTTVVPGVGDASGFQEVRKREKKNDANVEGRLGEATVDLQIDLPNAVVSEESASDRPCPLLSSPLLPSLFYVYCSSSLKVSDSC
uniref:Intimal thickness related receptor IRP domain-containing protein n=1 Tax=Chromera velia CCMP2878 TaxID=1169474 RepID=A0A0G4HYC7_9ALVE|eukprot:Cvel_9456.t1-p1 / transcript=Cvel_9456.t1 / gene=Cvel_9456 / organism=Chromera_velia_CCMP2878 / gene_product=hypothetical protein / transcript_product=hypothetical protein / location=Cvel_scaffold545:67502-71118(-) / protein_length=465 / sequence_SO=supercontig / SO=protein_coding / is_pseudo=false